MTSENNDLNLIAAFGSATPDKMAEVAETVDTFAHYLLQAATTHTELAPWDLHRIALSLADAAQASAQLFSRLGEFAEKLGTAPDRYLHDDGPLTDCSEMAATYLRESAKSAEVLGEHLDNAARFTGCIHSKS